MKTQQALELQNFDYSSKENEGRPAYFDVDQYLNCVEQMIVSDEVDRAIWMLDNMPGYYRDNVPDRAKKIKTDLYKSLFTILDYAACEDDIEKMLSAPLDDFNNRYMMASRAQVVFGRILDLNNQGITPHIVELGAGGYWLPIGLYRKGAKFTYFGESLNKKEQDAFKNLFSDIWRTKPLTESSHNIFISFEVLEHLSNPLDIVHYATKQQLDFNEIYLSTPKYTVISASPNWREAYLGHLRTYTPREFQNYAITYWPNMQWMYHDDQPMCLIGRKPDL